MTPQTAWAKPKGTYEFVPKPTIPIKSKGTTKYDAMFDSILANDTAMVVPQDDLPGILKAWARYEQNKGIEKQYSVRRKVDTKRRTYTFWVEKRRA